MASCNPVSIILVIDGSRGQRVLFRYPYEAPRQKVLEEKEKPRYSYALTPNEEEKSDSSRNFSGIKDGYLVGFSDSTLANILTPQPDICGTKFELKIDDVLFIGHPTLTQKQNTFKKSSESSRNEGVMMKLFNIVFVLQASVESTVLHCYHDLSKRLAIALKHEEHRCRYLSSERETMLSVHDEVCSMPEDCGETPYKHMLPRSKLAQGLKETFESLCENGTVRLKINSWVNVSFCLPQKVHNLSLGALHVTPEKIQTYLAAMRPYHTLLFLVDQDALMSLLPGDCSPVITRFARMASPLKSFQTLSQDTDIPLSQLFAVAAHLVYWGKATIIYPLCETNVYAVSPNASTYIGSPLIYEFTERFPRVSMHAVLSEFSLPTPLGEYRSPLGLLHQQAERVQMVVWMLQRRLLIQLHTYVSLLPMKQRESGDLPFNLGRRPIKWEFGGSFVGQVFPRNGRLVSDECKAEEEKIPEPADKLLSGLTYEEKRRVLTVPAAADPEDLKLFGKLVHYFRGKQHLEEIMYYENLRRSHLLTLLDKFREVLFIIQHEDPATSCWYNV